MSLPTVNSFWHGPLLGPLAVACLRSFRRQGHRVVLFAYEPPADVPADVELCSAETVMPRGTIDHLLSGRHFTIAANLFRYELLAHSLGLWVDCDCYCVRAVQDEDYIFGWEDNEAINTAVLKIPAESRLLSDLRSISEGFVPPWLPWSKRLDWHTRPLFGRREPLAKMPWGTTGPRALTYFARRRGVAGLAKPIETFYPVHYSKIDRLLDPSTSLAEIAGPSTSIVHLYNEMLRRHPFPPPCQSPLGRMLIAAS